MTEPGHFIVVEGLEGAGKSTALTTLKNYLADRQKPYICVREPGTTLLGEAIRKIIKEPTQEPLDARAELLLFYAARVQLVEQVIRPALEKGSDVLADRFELSTFAYQGGGRKLDLNMISQLSSFCLNEFKPDLVLFLDLTPEQGFARVHHRGPLDRIEQESLLFFHDVYKSYHSHIQQMNNVKIIDAAQPEPMVQQSIRQAMDNLFRRS